MSGSMRLSVALLFVVALGVSSSVIGRRGGQNPGISFSRHMERVRQFRCSEPQPRSYSSRDVLDVNLSTQEYILPPFTVIHRCDGGTGCCLQGEHMTCAMAQEQVVDLEFNIRNEFTKTVRPVTVQVTNHTLCSCQDVYATRE